MLRVMNKPMSDVKQNKSYEVIAMGGQRRRILFMLYAGLVFSLLLGGCQSAGTSLSGDVKEVAPGILQGYLSRDELPDSLELLDPPPEKGSMAYRLDQETAGKYIKSADSKRMQQAARDAELSFPAATQAFNSVLDIKVTEKDTPHLYMLMRRSLADAGLSTYAAKNHYRRKRPFMVNGAPTCTPKDEAALRKDGSYPSGHAAVGWAWALILVELYPGQTNEILQRGKQFGISRSICNVHWQSDVSAGRMMGSATVARLHANAGFQADLAAAGRELEALRSKNQSVNGGSVVLTSVKQAK